MASAATKTRGTSAIRPLKDSITLYVNEDCEDSREAERLLREAGLSFTSIPYHGSLDYYQQLPILFWRGGGLEGVRKIRSLLNFLKHWSNQPGGRNIFFTTSYRANT